MPLTQPPDPGDLLDRWRAGDQRAAEEIFRRHAGDLQDLVRRRLSGSLAGRLDPEDVVQSAFRSFFVAARAGRFDVRRGDDLWGLLATITLNKLRNQFRHNTKAKRAMTREQPIAEGRSLETPDSGPGPAETAALVDELEHILAALSPEQREMFEMRLQGHDLEEIAAHTGRCQRTVRRALKAIRGRLETLAEASPE